MTRPLGDLRREGLILHVWGDVLTMQGEYGAAFEKLEAAAALLERSGSPLEVSYVATSLGRAYRLNGLPEKALTYLPEGAGDLGEVRRPAGDRAGARRGVDRVTTPWAGSAEALDFAGRSLESARASGNRSMVISAVANLGRPAGCRRPLCRCHRACWRRSCEEPDEAMKRMEVISSCFACRAPTRASAGSTKPLAKPTRPCRWAKRDGPTHESLPRPRSPRRVRLARQDGPGASVDAQRALALVESMRAKLPAKDFLKQGFGEMGQQMFTLAIAVGVGLGDAPGTLVAAEQARSRAFQDLLATRELVGRAVTGAAPAGALASGASV